MKVREWKRMLSWLFLASIVLLTPGCKDLTEVDELNIVMALGIDETPDHQVQVTAEIVDPMGARSGPTSGGGGERSQAVFTREETGKTVEEAVDKFDENVARRLFLPHNTIVVFGRTYAEHGINRVMDYMERNRSYRRNQLWVVTDGTASQLLQASGKPESYNAVAIRTLVEQGAQKSVAVNSTQLVVMRQYLRPSHAPNFAYLTVSNSKLSQIGIGLFDGSQYKDHLEATDAQALLLFLGRTQQTEVNLPCSNDSTSGTDLQNTFRILGTTTDVVPVVRGDNVQFRVKIRGKAEIERLCPNSKTTSETYKKYETELASDMQDRMQSVLARLQKDNVDSVQFGTVLFEINPTAWRQLSSQWKQIFPHVQVNYDIQIQLLRNGLASKSPDTEFSPQGLPPHAGREGVVP